MAAPRTGECLECGAPTDWALCLRCGQAVLAESNAHAEAEGLEPDESVEAYRGVNYGVQDRAAQRILPGHRDIVIEVPE